MHGENLFLDRVARKKNDTQIKPNNFFVIWCLPWQFTHTNVYSSRCAVSVSKGFFFLKMKGTKVMGEKLNDEFANIF